MIFISHRGNLYKKHEETENTIESIDKALSFNLDVEIDIWYVNNKFYLGHDHPTHVINIEYLTNPKLWCHTKNQEALLKLKSLNRQDIHYFWHQEDQFTITSKGYIWSHSSSFPSSCSICVLPEQHNHKIEQINNSLGICSDQILLYMDKI